MHCHIEGAAHPELVRSKANKYGVNIDDIIDAQNRYIWNDFSSFLACYDKVASLFRSPQDYSELACDYLVRLANDNCIYCELFASSDHAARIGCDYITLIDAIVEGMNKARETTGIEARIIAVGVRHAGSEAVVEAAKLAANNPHPLVTGFGMAGDERMGRQGDFKRAFEIAGEAGLRLTTHAGEFGGADSVREALDELNVERIGHGVRAMEDKDLVKRLAEEQILLEVCPGSNIALGVCENYQSHPLRLLDEAGCKLCINSDDPPFFHTSLAHEYEISISEFHYDVDDLNRFTKNAISSAFVDEGTRIKLLEQLD